jgi:tetratricopeptide (TPR) repeat protein
MHLYYTKTVSKLKGKYDKAFEIFSFVIDRVDDLKDKENQNDVFKQLRFCSKTNMGLILEDLNCFQDARDLYQECLEESPNCIFSKELKQTKFDWVYQKKCAEIMTKPKSTIKM